VEPARVSSPQVDLTRYFLDKTPTLLVLHCLGATRSPKEEEVHSPDARPRWPLYRGVGGIERDMVFVGASAQGEVSWIAPGVTSRGAIPRTAPGRIRLYRLLTETWALDRGFICNDRSQAVRNRFAFIYISRYLPQPADSTERMSRCPV